MIKLEKLLAENMRRFGTKNLQEAAAAFEGEPMAKHPYFDQTIVVDLDGEKMELLFSNKPYTIDAAMQLALKEKAELPNRKQIDALNAMILPGSTVGAIWVQQDFDRDMENLDMRYILMDLSTKADYQVSGGEPKSEALVLLRTADGADAIFYMNKGNK